MKAFLTLSVLATTCLSGVASFVGLNRLGGARTSSPSLTTLQAGKGFGSTPPPEAPKKKKAPTTTTTENVAASAVEPTPAAAAPPPPPQQNAGQRALAEMRRQKAEEKDAELQKVREMLEADKQVQQQGGTAIPERVANRMGQRMLALVGVPLLGGMGAFVAFWYLATYRDLEFQPAVVAASTIAILVVSLLGITYSIMSTSWDEDREGSLLGTEEFQRNVDNVKQGLGRSQENAVLRDRLQSGQVRMEDVQKAANKKPKATTLSEKLQQDGLD